MLTCATEEEEKKSTTTIPNLLVKISIIDAIMIDNGGADIGRM